MLQDITAQGERRQEIRDQRPSSNFGTTLYCTVLDMGAMKPVTLFCLLLPVCAVFLTGSIACVAETLQKSIGLTISVSVFFLPSLYPEL